MALQYFKVSAHMDSLAMDLAKAEQAFAAAKVQIVNIDTKLGKLAGPENYQASIEAIDAEAAANPADPVWVHLKTRKDKLFAEGVALKQAVAAAVAALDQVG